MTRILEFPLHRRKPAFESGVFVAPWVGPNGETVLIAIDDKQRLVGEPAIVPDPSVLLDVGDALWAKLDDRLPAS